MNSMFGASSHGTEYLADVDLQMSSASSAEGTPPLEWVRAVAQSLRLAVPTLPVTEASRLARHKGRAFINLPPVAAAHLLVAAERFAHEMWEAQVGKRLHGA